MMKNFSVLLMIFVFAASVLSGCASGTHLVTGTQRKALSADDVTIYTEFPEQYEVIGIVTASSDAGWTAQGSLNYAVAELKKQAALIGANGIVIERVEETGSGGIFIENIYVIESAQKVSGKAIYVEPDKPQETAQ